MRLSTQPNTEPTVNAAIDAVKNGPVYIERNDVEVAVLISAEQYRRWRQDAVNDFQRFCDEISDRAEAHGMTEEKLEELLKDD